MSMIIHYVTVLYGAGHQLLTVSANLQAACARDAERLLILLVSAANGLVSVSSKKTNRGCSVRQVHNKGGVARGVPLGSADCK